MGVSGRAVVVVYVDNGLVWQLSGGEYITGISPSAAVGPVAVKAVQEGCLPATIVKVVPFKDLLFPRIPVN